MGKSFSENLKYAMDCKDVHTKELSILTGIKADTISSYLKSNGSEPTVSKALRLADALDVSIKFLVTGDDRPTKFVRPEVERLVRKLNSLSDNSIKTLSDLIDLMN